MPLAAMLREIENLRQKDRQQVTACYNSEIGVTAAKRAQAQIARDQHLAQVAEQEEQAIANANLVDRALAGVDAGIRGPIKQIKDSNNMQTWELFCRSFPLHRAIQCSKLQIIKVLFNPTDPKFFIDYTVNNGRYSPIYEVALSLGDEQQDIRNEMIKRILKDMPEISANLKEWFVKAVNLSPELINVSMPDQGITPAMQLAKDNHLATLMIIDEDLSELREDMQDDSIGIDFAKQDLHGKTILNYALEQGHKDLSLWLLEKTGLQLSAIEQACINCEAREVERLLAINDGTVDPAIRNNAPLLWAIIHNHNDVVARLIASNRVDLKAHNNIAVITAVRYGCLEIAQQLIDAGADLKAQDDLALKFAKSLTAETQELRDRKQSILDFVLNARRNAPKSDQEKTQAAIDIQYLWKSYQLLKQEQAMRTNIDIEEIAALPPTIINDPVYLEHRVAIDAVFGGDPNAVDLRHLLNILVAFAPPQNIPMFNAIRAARAIVRVENNAGPAIVESVLDASYIDHAGRTEIMANNSNNHSTMMNLMSGPGRAVAHRVWMRRLDL